MAFVICLKIIRAKNRDHRAAAVEADGVGDISAKKMTKKFARQTRSSILLMGIVILKVIPRTRLRVTKITAIPW